MRFSILFSALSFCCAALYGVPESIATAQTFPRRFDQVRRQQEFRRYFTVGEKMDFSFLADHRDKLQKTPKEGELSCPTGINLPGENLPATITFPKGRLWDETYINGIVAVVNDRVVTAGELRQEMAPVLLRLENESHSQAEFDEKAEIVAHDVLQSMVDRLLVIEEFYRRGFQIPQVEKSAQLEGFIQEQFGGDRLKFMEQLHDYGKSLQRFRREMEESFVVNIMLNHIRQSRSEISPLRIQTYYEENRQRFFRPEAVRIFQIYLPSEKELASDANLETMIAGCVELKPVLERLSEANEATFREVAADHGSDMRTDWIAKNDLREELSSVVFATQVKTMTAPIPLKNQVVLIFVSDYRDASFAPIEEVQNQIESTLLQKQLKEAQERWIQGLREKAFIRTYL